MPDDYAILDATNCRYGVLKISPRAELLDIIEKPDFLICSDGKQRVRTKDGEIVPEMTTEMLLFELETM